MVTEISLREDIGSWKRNPSSDILVRSLGSPLCQWQTEIGRWKHLGGRYLGENQMEIVDGEISPVSM